MAPQRFQLTITAPAGMTACDALADHTGMSKGRIKRAMIRGAVWLARNGRRMKRLRRAAAILRPGDVLTCFYDPAILDCRVPTARCIQDQQRYSIWYKPAGMLTQGTRFGDHCALLRQVESHFGGKRAVLPVHRIDREASGLVLVAHDRDAAARLSALLRNHAIHKTYRVWVRGDLGRHAVTGTIDLTVDAKTAVTHFKTLHYDATNNRTLAAVTLQTGRLHQIRRHFAAIGFPVMGDPRYGQGNKNGLGLQLLADGLRFECPFGNGLIAATCDDARWDHE